MRGMLFATFVIIATAELVNFAAVGEVVLPDEYKTVPQRFRCEALRVPKPTGCVSGTEECVKSIVCRSSDGRRIRVCRGWTCDKLQ